jgi:LysM repeat protein
MAKPNSQTGHGSFGGTEDESSLAHREASRGDSEGDGGHEADWEIPDAHDNSPLSRILGLVLVIVLAGVFSFVAYRKYDEARRNPASQTADATGLAPADSPAEPDAAPFAGENASHESQNSVAAISEVGTKSENAFAQSVPKSAAAFGSLDERPSERPANNPNTWQQNSSTPGKVSLSQTQPPTSQAPAQAQEPDANPFGDLGSPPERQRQQPLLQSEPRPQFANAPVATPSIKAGPGGQFPPGGSQNPAASAAMPGTTAQVASRATPAADADLQNLFPNEGNPKHEPASRSAQSVAPRSGGLEPAGLTRTAESQNHALTSQKQLAQTPPSQSEPLDNESLDEPHVAAHPATGNPGMAQLRQNSATPKPESISGLPKANRAQALLADNEREPVGDDSAFSKPQPPSGAIVRPTPQVTIQPHSSVPLKSNRSLTPAPGGPSPSAVEDPFATNRPSTATGRAGFGQPGAVDGSLASSGHAPVGRGSVTAVGTASDSGDYYEVQPADNFWTISRKKYGTSRYFQALAEHNKSRIPDPARIRPGMKVSTPTADVLEERYAQFLPGSKVQVTSAEETAKSAPTGFVVKSDGTAVYRTGEHDTLSDIAAKHLGRSSRWIQIFEMNRDKLSNPNQLKVGIELALPGDASNVAVTTDDDNRR